MRHRFALYTAYMTVFALILGNLVVATNAGEACGTDWPICNGKIIPDVTQYKVLIEYSHRIFTSLLGLAILLNFIYAWKRRYLKESAVKIWALLTMVLLLIQSLVGALNVVLGTPPGFTTIDVTVSLFLLMSTVFLATALQRTRIRSTEKAQAENNSYHILIMPAFWAFSLFFLEIIVGAFFKHSGASKILHNIVVNELMISSVSLSQFIYSVHGISNAIILISAAYLMFWCNRRRVLFKEAVSFFTLLVLNGVTGYLTQISGLQEWASSLHMIVVIVTVFQGAYLLSKSYFGPYYINKSVAKGM